MWHIYSIHTKYVAYVYVAHVQQAYYMWHMMAASLDQVVQIMQAAEGLKAVSWQRQAQPSDACTLCSSS